MNAPVIYFLAAGIVLCLAGVVVAARAQTSASRSIIRYALGGIVIAIGALGIQFLDEGPVRTMVAVLFTLMGLSFVVEDHVRTYLRRRRGRIERP